MDPLPFLCQPKSEGIQPCPGSALAFPRQGLAKPAHALVCLCVFLSQGWCCSSSFFRTRLVSGTAIKACSALWKDSCATSPTSCLALVRLSFVLLNSAVISLQTLYCFMPLAAQALTSCGLSSRLWTARSASTVQSGAAGSGRCSLAIWYFESHPLLVDGFLGI